MTHLKLPRFQYSAREPVSGACFTGYADELSKSYATFLAEQLSVHLAGHGVDLTRLTWQTDNGCEFLENQDEQGLPAPAPSWDGDGTKTLPRMPRINLMKNGFLNLKPQRDPDERRSGMKFEPLGPNMTFTGR